MSKKLKHLSLSQIKFDDFKKGSIIMPILDLFLFIAIIVLLLAGHGFISTHPFIYFLIPAVFCGFLLSVYDHLRNGKGYLALSYKIADFLIENKSQNELKKEIEDLIKNNDFVRYYLKLFNEDYGTFREDFLSLLQDLKHFNNNFNIDLNIKPFTEIKNNQDYLAFLIYLNNLHLTLRSQEYLKFLAINNIKQLEIIKENITLTFKRGGKSLIKFDLT